MSRGYSQALESRGEEVLRRLSGVEAPVVVEIGVATGKLSRFLLKKRNDLILYMVDNWLPQEKQPVSYVATNDSNSQLTEHAQVDRRQCALTVKNSFSDRADILNMNSVDAAQIIQNGIDLVFLDADHSYSGVTADILAWKGKVKKGGWLGGHDYKNFDSRFNFEVTKAVDDLFPLIEIGANYTWWVLR